MIVHNSLGHIWGKREIIAGPFRGKFGHVAWLCRCICGRLDVITDIRILHNLSNQCIKCLNATKGKSIHQKRVEKNKERDALIVDLYAATNSFYEVAQIIGNISHETVRVVCRDAGVLPVNPRKKSITAVRGSVVYTRVNPGDRYGKLVVIGPSEWKKSPRGVPIEYHDCVCDCGELVSATNHRIRHSGKCLKCIYEARLGKKQVRGTRTEPGESGFKRVRNSYHWNAARRDNDWSLTDTDCMTLFKGNCYYCGVPPSKRLYRSSARGPLEDRASFEYNGIDRVDNTKGYSPDNTVSCCSVCNHAKATMSKDEFIKWIVRAATNLGSILDAEEVRFALVPQR